jgi:hypothetical protein
MNEPRSMHEWQLLYAAAMLESDSSQLRSRVEKADQAIRARIRELPKTPAPLGSEQSELLSALYYLSRLDVA